jgi:predicted ATPase
VEALLDTKRNQLGAGFREQLFHRTEGHPLFTVELLRAMEERGDLVRDADGSLTQGPALHWEKLPARVEAAIAERIGRLPERCRMLLAAASVEGEEFTAEVVAHTMNVNVASVVECLSSDLGERHRLVTAVSFRRLGTHRISRYRFRHNLFQRYLYDHLDGVRRAYLHEAVGSALELLHGESPDELHGLAPRLAWHFELAGLADQGAHILRLAQRCALAGQVNEGLDSLDEAQAWIDHTGVRLLEAEVHRLRGDLLLMDQATDADALHAAETSFRAAIAVARRQEARWWELRATVSLCRLLREQSTVNEARRAEARQMLAEIYGWFSEGFDTLDLREARETLEVMGAGEYHNE